MLVLDASDRTTRWTPARYTAPGEAYWGVYKATNSPWIYGSGGLRIFKQLGKGTIGRK